MRRHLILAAILAVAGLACLTRADAFWQSRDSNYNVSIVSSGSSYTGSGDAVSGANGYYSASFAYTSALRGTKAINLCLSPNGVDVLCQDVNSDATTGIVSSTETISATVCGTNASVNLCTIKIFYDQTTSGIGNLTQTSVGVRAVFVPNKNGTIPAACSQDGSGLLPGNATNYNGGAAGSHTASSYTMSWTPQGTHAINERGMWGQGAGAGMVLGVNSTPAAFMYNGAFDGSPISVANGTWYAQVGTSAASGVSGTLNLNASSDSTGINGGNTLSGAVGLWGDNGGGGSANGCGLEFRFDPVQLSGGNVSTLITNMRSAGRGNF